MELLCAGRLAGGGQTGDDDQLEVQWSVQLNVQSEEEEEDEEEESSG
jgi:hypothetical protein